MRGKLERSDCVGFLHCLPLSGREGACRGVLLEGEECEGSDRGDLVLLGQVLGHDPSGHSEQVWFRVLVRGGNYGG